MVALLTEEERAQMSEGWHIVRGSQPFVERIRWAKVTSFGDTVYAFLINRDGKEMVFRDDEKGEIYQAEREAWEALAQDMADDIAAAEDSIQREQKIIAEDKAALEQFRRDHGL